jgi:SAM-dependent methyltransferase
MNEISINDLPLWTDWPARLLGLSDFSSVSRDRAKIEAEYSRDKWQKCLDSFEESGGHMNAADLRQRYYDLGSPKQRASVSNGKLVVANNAEVMQRYDDILVNGMAEVASESRSIVELGCGFGHILWMLRTAFPGKAFVGGDYADSAVSLAAKLFQSHIDISVQKFDFYAPNYKIIEEAEGPVVVFTSQALEQIPYSAGVVDTLSKYRQKIARVFHLEPAYALYDNSLLGLMRRRYIEMNDYNRDLISTLQGRKDVEILQLRADAIGWNPFNSLAFVEWRFT